MKLGGLVPNFLIHVSVNNIYIPTMAPPIFSRTDHGNISITHKYINVGMWEGRTVSFLGISVSNFLYSVFSV